MKSFKSSDRSTSNYEQANVAPEMYFNDGNMSEATPFRERLSAVRPAFEPLLTASETADMLRIHEKTVQKFAREGKLPGCKIGKAWFFRASLLDDWVRMALQSQVPVTA